ncbi:MAG: LapA family protein [Rhodothermales bacterium]|nr:LapA family protein [Rhodothermales bacterium]
MNFALVLSLLIAIVAVVFAFQNPQTMSVHFLGYESVDASTALVLLITFGLGLLTGWFGAIPARLRSASEARALRKERDALMGRLNSASPAATAPVATTASAPDPYTARFGNPNA